MLIVVLAKVTEGNWALMSAPIASMGIMGAPQICLNFVGSDTAVFKDNLEMEIIILILCAFRDCFQSIRKY